MPQNMICTQRLALTADGSQLVPDTDPRAATLYAAPGDEIPASAAEKFGLVDGALPAKKTKGEAKPAATGETKPAAKAETKA